jgi:CubicO group peptidase (beta-lactamase class C family)
MISAKENIVMNKCYDEITKVLDLIKYGGTICISKENNIVYEKAMGKADYERDIINQMSTTFFIASVTKQFTAASILLLKERGKLNLDVTIDKFIPSYAHANKITIRHLLNMSSGIADYLNDIIDMQYREEALKIPVLLSQKCLRIVPSRYIILLDNYVQAYSRKLIYHLLICN